MPLFRRLLLLAYAPDFLPFPELIPLFELPEPLAAVTGFTDLVILAITAAAMVALTWLIKFTRLGKAMRATAQDQTMALLLGIDVNRVISATFVIGSALAALGGLLIASHVGQINFSIGFIAGIKAFTAAVLGSFILGLTEAFAAGYVSSDYEDVFAFSLLVLILIFRPAGILGRAAQEKV